MNDIDVQDRLYAPKQVAEILAVSRGEIYRLMSAGDLAYHQLGKRCRRVSEAAIQDLLHRTRRNGTGDSENGDRA